MTLEEKTETTKITEIFKHYPTIPYYRVEGCIVCGVYHPESNLPQINRNRLPPYADSFFNTMKKPASKKGEIKITLNMVKALEKELEELKQKISNTPKKFKEIEERTMLEKQRNILKENIKRIKEYFYS